MVFTARTTAAGRRALALPEPATRCSGGAKPDKPAKVGERQQHLFLGGAKLASGTRFRAGRKLNACAFALGAQTSRPYNLPCRAVGVSGVV